MKIDVCRALALCCWTSWLTVIGLPLPSLAQEKELDTEATLEIGQWALKADEAAKDGKFKEAIKFDTQIIEKYPGYAKRILLHRADCYFSDCQIKLAIADYDKLIALEPEISPHLWQRGLALYYADEFEKGWKQFENHQKVNTQDVENAAWHFLCLAREKDVKTAREKLISISRDTRVPMKQVHDLFAGKSKPEDVLKAAREKRSKSAIYYAYLYIGLYEEAAGNHEESIKMMKLAAKNVPFQKDVLMGQIANIHLQLRNKQK